jgi:hypothetical protein
MVLYYRSCQLQISGDRGSDDRLSGSIAKVLVVFVAARRGMKEDPRYYRRQAEGIVIEAANVRLRHKRSHATQRSTQAVARHYPAHLFGKEQASCIVSASLLADVDVLAMMLT